MRCFRLSHAGIIVESEGTALVVDPGSFSDGAELSAAIASAAPIVGLVITHEHADHWTPEHVAAVLAASPGIPVLTTEATAAALRDLGVDGVEVVVEGDARRLGPFALEFYGGRHEVLHASIPVIDNIGVRVNDALAYGGDSLVRPPFSADLLGVPIGSPWSNLAQIIDFVLAAKPRRAYLTHDAMLSSAGLGLFGARVGEALATIGAELVELPRLDADRSARLEL